MAPFLHCTKESLKNSLMDNLDENVFCKAHAWFLKTILEMQRKPTTSDRKEIRIAKVFKRSAPDEMFVEGEMEKSLALRLARINDHPFYKHEKKSLFVAWKEYEKQRIFSCSKRLERLAEAQRTLQGEYNRGFMGRFRLKGLQFLYNYLVKGFKRGNIEWHCPFDNIWSPFICLSERIEEIKMGIMDGFGVLPLNNCFYEKMEPLDLLTISLRDCGDCCAFQKTLECPVSSGRADNFIILNGQFEWNHVKDESNFQEIFYSMVDYYAVWRKFCFSIMTASAECNCFICDSFSLEILINFSCFTGISFWKLLIL